MFAGQMTIEGVRNKKAELTSDIIAARIPFDSAIKMGSTVVDRGNGMLRVYTKGAPDFLLNGRVTEVLTSRGVESMMAEP